MAYARLSDNFPLDLPPFTPVENTDKAEKIDLNKNLQLAENPISLHLKWIAEGRAKKTLTDLLGLVSARISRF